MESPNNRSSGGPETRTLGPQQGHAPPLGAWPAYKPAGPQTQACLTCPVETRTLIGVCLACKPLVPLTQAGIAPQPGPPSLMESAIYQLAVSGLTARNPIYLPSGPRQQGSRSPIPHGTGLWSACCQQPDSQESHSPALRTHRVIIVYLLINLLLSYTFF